MHRYAVRFLVAVLTFGIGVVLSLVLGLFRVQDLKLTQSSNESNSCRRNFRVARPAFLTIDSLPTEPLKLSVMKATPHSHVSERDIQLLIENRSDRTISGYSISGRGIWVTDDRAEQKALHWTSNINLEPGESRLITLPHDRQHDLSLRLDDVTFSDGSSWTNSHESR